MIPTCPRCIKGKMFFNPYYRRMECINCGYDTAVTTGIDNGNRRWYNKITLTKEASNGNISTSSKRT